MSILDEESRFPKATDATLADKLHSGPGNQSQSSKLGHIVKNEVNCIKLGHNTEK